VLYELLMNFLYIEGVGSMLTSMILFHPESHIKPHFLPNFLRTCVENNSNTFLNCESIVYETSSLTVYKQYLLHWLAATRIPIFYLG
jgi:hypothetical protein